MRASGGGVVFASFSCWPPQQTRSGTRALQFPREALLSKKRFSCVGDVLPGPTRAGVYSVVVVNPGGWVTGLGLGCERGRVVKTAARRLLVIRLSPPFG